VLRRKATSKTYLKILMLAGVLAVIGGGAGTFASFTAETTNAGNTFQTGTLVLGNVANSATTCYSSTNTANAQSCTAGIFPSLVNDLVPAQTPLEGHITLTNDGTITPGTLMLYAPTLNTTTGAPDPAGTLGCVSIARTTGVGTHPFSGSGSLCTGLKLQIFETANATLTTQLAATNCIYPVLTGACGTSTGTPGGLPIGVVNAYNLGSLTIATPRYFYVKLTFPSAGSGGADNVYQALKAFFNLTWHLEA
jgi:predicted ribosomally synthesized peptide with SipW-like signal peptide